VAKVCANFKTSAVEVAYRAMRAFTGRGPRLSSDSGSNGAKEVMLQGTPSQVVVDTLERFVIERDAR